MTYLFGNYATFIASSRTLDIIESCIDTYSGFFDFDKIAPTPALLNRLAAPTQIIDDEQFQRAFGDTPTTIDEMSSHLNSAPEISFDKAEICAIKADTHITRTMADILIDNYGANDWKQWQENNWGCHNLGTETHILHRSKHILSIEFITHNGPPVGIYNTLQESFGDIHIIAGCTYDRDTKFSTVCGYDNAFNVYWKNTIVPDITPVINTNTNSIVRASIHNKHHIKPQHYILAQMEDEGFYIDENLETHEFL